MSDNTMTDDYPASVGLSIPQALGLIVLLALATLVAVGFVR